MPTHTKRGASAGADSHDRVPPRCYGHRAQRHASPPLWPSRPWAHPEPGHRLPHTSDTNRTGKPTTLCSCTSHHWLARPCHPPTWGLGHHRAAHRAGDAYGTGLTVVDRRTNFGDHTPLLVEVCVDTEVTARVPVTPVGGHLPGRDGMVSSLGTVHGRLLGTDW